IVPACELTVAMRVRRSAGCYLGLRHNKKMITAVTITIVSTSPGPSRTAITLNTPSNLRY
ncbi:MAG: hypothetical protein KAT00_13860, partial [Planctomycetes bacterium]|nr:hypothetical protein [Planctomycetota bacterium]